MDTTENLIAEGKKLIDEYNKRPRERYSCVSGLDYEIWMGKVKVFANTELQSNPMREELDSMYKRRNNYLGTMAVEKVLGVLCAIQSTKHAEEKEGKGMKIFISHSSKDKAYGDCLIELLKGLGLKREEIIYTSNELYGIPLGKNIYDYLRENIDMEIHMLFLLSENYFSSVACLNEMGASWLAQKDHTIICVPDFDFNMRQFNDCCLDSKEMGLLMNNYIRITEFKTIIESKFCKKIDDMEWQSLLEKYKNDIDGISS